MGLFSVSEGAPEHRRCPYLRISRCPAKGSLTCGFVASTALVVSWCRASPRVRALDRAVTPFRTAGGDWDMAAKQGAAENGYYTGPPRIELTFTDVGHVHVGLNPTTGEARVMARQLVALADTRLT